MLVSKCSVENSRRRPGLLLQKGSRVNSNLDMCKTLYQVKSFSTDVWCCFDQTPQSHRQRLFSRPLRQFLDGSLCVIYQGKAYGLYAGDNEELVFFLNSSDVELDQVTTVQSGAVFELEYAWDPAQQKLDDLESKWLIDTTQFSINILLKAPETLIQELVSQLLKKHRLNILSWDSIDDGPWAAQGFDWIVKLSTGLRIEHIKEAINQFFGNDAYKFRLRDLREKLDNTHTTLEIDNNNYSQTKDYEEEVVRLSQIILEKESIINSIKDNEETRSASLSLKKSATEKIVARMLYQLFKNLAFPPESPRTLVDRFSESKSVWALLGKLNSDPSSFKSKALHGTAGKVGWKELTNHLATGNDNRGRIYIRNSSEGHKLDVVLNWKKDDKEQHTFIAKLANFKPFRDREVLFE